VTERSVFAPGKILLFGEHSAVFGYPAVGTSIDRGMTITAAPAETMSMAIMSDSDSGVAAIPEESLASFSRFLAGILPDVPPARITVRSDLPISSGFGSSAALCTAIARWAQPGDSTHATWSLAHRIEAFFHGTPSGVDTGLTTLGGVRAFNFRNKGGGAADLPEAIALPSALPPLVVGSVPRTRTTRELVAAVQTTLQKHPDTVRPVLDRLGEITTRAIDVLRAGRVDIGTDAADITVLADLATAARTQLATLPIDSESVGNILDAGCAAGALAGKPSGAGAGGAFYLLCPDRATADDVLRSVRAKLPPGGVAF
jgi:mevalonate kinase